MPDDTPYELKIAEEFRTMWALLNQIEPPAGHRWTTGPGDPLRWFGGSIAESTRSGASIFLRRREMDDGDDRQLHVGVRLAWDGVGRVGDAALPKVRRAILWCEMGPRILASSRSTPLIGDRARFYHAPDIESLFEQIGHALLPALSIHRERLASPDRDVQPSP